MADRLGKVDGVADSQGQSSSMSSYPSLNPKPDDDDDLEDDDHEPREDGEDNGGSSESDQHLLTAVHPNRFSISADGAVLLEGYDDDKDCLLLTGPHASAFLRIIKPTIERQLRPLNRLANSL